ncbi:Hemicentin-2 [Manis pentadactyla]|nr:Hemicentin-2 [Manis pentadactyla]
MAYAHGLCWSLSPVNPQPVQGKKPHFMALDLNFQVYHTDFLHVKCLKMFMAEQKTSPVPGFLPCEQDGAPLPLASFLLEEVDTDGQTRHGRLGLHPAQRLHPPQVPSVVGRNSVMTSWSPGFGSRGWRKGASLQT